MSPPCSNKFFGKVDYLPNDYNGNMNSFTKLEEYEWQKEWRIAILDPTRHEPVPTTLKIGDIKSITKVYDTEFLISEGFKISLNED